MQDKENEEKMMDIKGVFNKFIEEEPPELSQEEEIKLYKDGEINYKKKNKKSEDDEESQDDDHLKRLKQELLESLERVNILAKKLFDEKEKMSLKDIKVSEKEVQKSKNREQVMEQMREKVKEQKERSREE